MSVDPVRLEVTKGAFETIADEMAIVLMRTSFSAIVRDAMDFSTAICDAEGRTLAQGLTTPLHLGSIYDAMVKLRDTYGDNVHPGDVYIGNDPYLAAGQHLPDIYIIKPLFVCGEIGGWAVALAHHADVGGIVPGSNALGSNEIYQEGLRIPFLKLYDRGELDTAIWQLLSANVRVPDMVLGDLTAQIVSCNAADKGFSNLVDRLGLVEVRKYMNALNDYAEELTRRAIASIRDGVYEYTHYIDGVGENPSRIVLKVAVTVDGESVCVDWTGSSPQVPAGINSPLPFTKAAVYTALRSVMSSDIPTCHGFNIPITVIAPEASIVNPVSPAPCGARGITGFRMVDCLFGALSKVLPSKVAADAFGGSSNLTFSSNERGKTFILCETMMGNSGGTSVHDGQEGVTHVAANQSNVPVEVIETEYPIRVEYYGFEADTCGPGKQRGGLGIRRDYRVLSDNVRFYIRSDKRDNRPQGLFGGGEGAGSLTVINPGYHELVLPVMMAEPVQLRKGDLVRHVLAGGGGYGPPLERPRDAIRRDLEEMKITIGYARRHYSYEADIG